MKSPEATILGKEIYVFDSQIKTTSEEVESDLKQFDTLSLLREIADLGNHIYKSRAELILYRQIPVNDSFLIFSALFIINCGPLNNGIDASKADLQRLFRKLWYLYDQDVNHENLTPNEILIRVAYRQFQYQGELLNGLSRTIHIYKNIWPNRTKMKENDIFQETLGLSLDQLFFHAFSILASDNAYFYRNNPEFGRGVNDSLDISISEESENAFLKWASRSLDAIRAYEGPLENALQEYPILETGIVPSGAQKAVFLLLTKNCLYLKLAQYLYFDFVDQYSGGNRENIFKETFGYAFQDYLGHLLTNHFKSWDVVREIRYRKCQNHVDTVDWMLKRNDRLVLIEVKQSSVFLQTKKTGSIDSYKQDCKKTLAKAFSQLKTTKDDIEVRSFPELEFMGDVRRIEMVCVVADPLYFGNMLLSELGDDFPEMHVINISDFENLLEIQKNDQNLHYLLCKKRKKKRLQAMDFREYNISLVKGPSHKASQFLCEVFDDYFTSLGIG